MQVRVVVSLVARNERLVTRLLHVVHLVDEGDEVFVVVRGCEQPLQRRRLAVGVGRADGEALRDAVPVEVVRAVALCFRMRVVLLRWLGGNAAVSYGLAAVSYGLAWIV